MVIEMLCQAPRTRTARLFRWMAHLILLRPAHPVADIRELSPYLRADIGAVGGDRSFRGDR
jgi:hypothetical protein